MKTLKMNKVNKN